MIPILLPLLLMTLLGVPHGALDGYVIRSLSRNAIESVILFGLYALIALASVGVWVLFPTVSMLSFLVISAVHFGRSDIVDTQIKQPVLAIVARGGLWTVCLPTIHWQSTAVIFDHLRTDVQLVQIALFSALIPWAIVSMTHLIIEFRHRNRRVCIEWLLYFLLVISVPPLWALCVYFCGWHARRHMFRVFRSAQNTRHAVRDMLLFTGATFCIAGAVYFFYARHIELTPAAIMIFFVGLFALTVPHMVLIDSYLPHQQRHGRIDI